MPRCLRRHLEPGKRGRGEALVRVYAGAAAGVARDVRRLPGSTPTLQVLVYEETPRTLNKTSGSEARLSSRVPVVRALRLIWALPMEVLVESATSELWARSEFVQLREPRRAEPTPASTMSSVIWPQGLEHLVLDTRYTVPSEGVRWPPNLRRLTFGSLFNQPVVGVVMAGLPAAAIIPAVIQPAHSGSSVACLPAAAIVRTLQPTHPWSCVAHLPAPALTRFSF